MSTESWRNWSSIEKTGAYKFKGTVDEDEDLSGIRFDNSGFGLIGADEAANVQHIEIHKDRRELRVVGRVTLANSGDEIDIEAIAADGKYFYITASHGVAKKSGELQPSRFNLFRLEFDPRTQRPRESGGLARTTLAPILQDDSVLAPYYQKPLQQKGINIEGLAARDGQLYIGLRNPNLQGNAFILEVPADSLFQHTPPKEYTLHQVPLGPGLGIRDMAPAKDCFLIIAGNAGADPSDKFPRSQDYIEDRPFELFAWTPQHTHHIGVIPDTPGKAEALAVLEESPTQLEILVLFDGPEKGRPMTYEVR